VPFTWAKVSELKHYPIDVSNPETRTNLIFFFHNTEDLLVLVDCTSCRNLAIWKLLKDVKVTTFRWNGSVDCVENLREWVLNVKFWIKKELKLYQQHSYAFLVSDDRLFNGCGAYMRSEILGRLHLHFGWSASAAFQEDWSENSILVLMMAICRVVCANIQYWYKYFDIKKHPLSYLFSFYIRYLEIYGKPGTVLWRLNGRQKMKFHSFDTSLPPPNIDAKEHWIVTKKNLITAKKLGVGPIWWHSNGDCKELGVETYKERQQKRRRIQRDCTEEDFDVELEQNDKFLKKDERRGNPISRMRNSFKSLVAEEVQQILFIVCSN